MSKRKLLPDSSNPNQDFCDFLLELAEYEKNVSRNIYKHNAYRKAASVLSKHPTRIQSKEEASKLSGIGKKIADKIEEFMQTGHLAKLDKIRASDDAVAITQLTRVSGIGPAKARDLYTRGVTSLDELRKRTDLLNHHQKLGLKYVEEFESRIPRAEVAAIEKHVQSLLAAMDPQYQATVCGSYRRGAESSGDVDFLLTHPSFTSSDGQKAGGHLLRKVVDKLTKDGFVTDSLSLGDSKFMGVCILPGDQYTVHRRIDIRIVPHDQYYCALLYFTGSDEFNRQMRTHALARGFTLNEYSLRPVGSTGTPGEPVPVGSEREIFEYIDYPYRPPAERSI